MARANLHVTDQLRDAFSNAAGTGTRWLSVAIEGETLVHSGTGNQAGENLEQDFDTIVAAIAQNESTPALFIVRNDADKWHVLLYNPEGAPVRDKMLYAAACEDTKLALSLAENAFNATCLEDVEFAAFNAMFNRSNAQPLSEAEVLAKQERQASKQAATCVVSSAMGTVPFQLEADVAPAVEQLVSGTVNWVEFIFDADKETVQKGRCATLPADEPCSSILDPDAPRFYALSRPSGDFFFVYSCPEAAAIKLKMCYSTCKATMLAVLSSAPFNLQFAKTFEIREAADLDGELADVAASAAAPKLEHAAVSSRPAPPKGQRRRKKRRPKHIFGSQ